MKRKRKRKSIFVFFPVCLPCNLLRFLYSRSVLKQWNQGMWVNHKDRWSFGNELVPSKVRNSLLCSPGTPLTLCNDLYENFVLVQSPSRVWLFETPWTAACQASLSFTISWDLLKLMSFWHDAIQPSHPLSPFTLLFAKHFPFISYSGQGIFIVSYKEVIKIQKG